MAFSLILTNISKSVLFIQKLARGNGHNVNNLNCKNFTSYELSLFLCLQTAAPGKVKANLNLT
jgi:hypothetical protein